MIFDKNLIGVDLMLNVRQTKMTLTDSKVQNVLHAALNQEIFSYFESADGKIQWLGIGSTSRFYPDSSSDRFAQVKDWYDSLKKRFTQKTDLSKIAIFGGFSFDDRYDPSGVYGEWSAGVFILPRVIFKIHDNDIFISEIKQHSFDDESIENTIDEIIDLAQKQKNLHSYSIQDLDPDWPQQVDQLASQIKHSQTLTKVVLGRFKKGAIKGQLDPVLVLKALRALNKTTYHFILKIREQVFISSTPERLFKIEGEQFQTAAVAGTIQRGNDQLSDNKFALELFKDKKNRQEHQIVVNEIYQRIKQFADDISKQDQPMILKNQTVQHLYTPMSAKLNQKVNLFDIIKIMHPTPALGGSPKDEAVKLIESLEVQSRGLFGSPIGYITFDSDCEMIVGIRSMYLNGQNFLMFAGAGIMPDSVGRSEFQETELKFQPMIKLLKYLED